MIDPVRFTQELVSIPSVSGSGRYTPELRAVMNLVASTARKAGMDVIRQEYTLSGQQYPGGSHSSEWMVCVRGGLQRIPDTVMALGHVDVVPALHQPNWMNGGCFNGEIRNLGGLDIIAARGVLDMKSAVAAWLASMNDHGSIAIAADEEHVAQGVTQALKHLRNESALPACYIGLEPTSEMSIGDQIKMGRRGDLVTHAVFEGPDAANELVLRLFDFIQQEHWDEGKTDDMFPPNRSEIVTFTEHQDNTNVIPAQAHALIQFQDNNDLYKSIRHFAWRCIGEFDNQAGAGHRITFSDPVRQDGKMKVFCTVTGVSGHSARPSEFYNPNTRLIHVLGRILRNGVPLQVLALGNETHADWLRAAPNRAGLTIDTRLNTLRFPGPTSLELETILKSKDGDPLQVTVYHSFASGSYIADTAGLPALLCREVLEPHGKAAKHDFSGGYADTCVVPHIVGSREIAELGMPRLRMAKHFESLSIVGGGMHQANEAVAVEDIRELTRHYAALQRQFAVRRMAEAAR